VMGDRARAMAGSSMGRGRRRCGGGRWGRRRWGHAEQSSSEECASGHRGLRVAESCADHLSVQSMPTESRMRCEQVRAFLHAPSRHGFRSAGSLARSAPPGRTLSGEPSLLRREKSNTVDSDQCKTVCVCVTRAPPGGRGPPPRPERRNPDESGGPGPSESET